MSNVEDSWALGRMGHHEAPDSDFGLAAVWEGCAKPSPFGLIKAHRAKKADNKWVLLQLVTFFSWYRHWIARRSM